MEETLIWRHQVGVAHVCVLGGGEGDWSKTLKIRHRNSAVVLGFVCCRTNMVVLNQMSLRTKTKYSKSRFHLSLCITVSLPVRLYFLRSRQEFCRHRAYNASETKISSMFPSGNCLAQLLKAMLSKYYCPLAKYILRQMPIGITFG
jgi:hypothetical protein